MFSNCDPGDIASHDSYYIEDEAEDMSDVDSFVQEDMYWPDQQVREWSAQTAQTVQTTC